MTPSRSFSDGSPLGLLQTFLTDEEKGVNWAIWGTSS